MAPVEDFLQVYGDNPSHDDADMLTDNATINPAKEFLQVNGDRLQHDTDNDVTMKPVQGGRVLGQCGLNPSKCFFVF